MFACVVSNDSLFSKSCRHMRQTVGEDGMLRAASSVVFTNTKVKQLLMLMCCSPSCRLCSYP